MSGGDAGFSTANGCFDIAAISHLGAISPEKRIGGGALRSKRHLASPSAAATDDAYLRLGQCTFADHQGQRVDERTLTRWHSPALRLNPPPACQFGFQFLIADVIERCLADLCAGICAASLPDPQIPRGFRG